ncbi:MAG: nitroreductase family protein [Alphaproteobacteria bacterium]
MADDTPPDLSALWDARFGLPVPDGVDRTHLDAVARILGRRTIRRYRAEPVTDGLLDLLIACARSAPSKSDLQQASILVVKDPAKRATIAGWLPSQPWVGQAPAFLVFLADMRRMRRLADIHGMPNDNDNVDGFLNAVVDAALAMEAFALAADAVGLGSCCISMIRDHIEKATPLLELPPGVFPIAGLCLGWPENPGRMSMRLPAEGVVHVDRYDDSGLADAVAAYDRRRHAQAPIAPSGQRATEKWGVSEFCGWSENSARQMSLPERAGFRAFLARHGVALA